MMTMHVMWCTNESTCKQTLIMEENPRVLHQVTLLNTWYDTPQILVPSRRSGAPLRRNPSPAGEYSSLSVYGFHRSPDWVEMCISLLGCVRVDPRKPQNNGINHLYTRFPLVRRFRDFHPITACELRREKSIPVKTQHKEWVYIGHLQP